VLPRTRTLQEPRAGDPKPEAETKKERGTAMGEPLHVLDDLADILMAEALRELRRLIRETLHVARDPRLILVAQLLPRLAHGISQRAQAMNRAILSPAEPIGSLLTKLVGE